VDLKSPLRAPAETSMRSGTVAQARTYTFPSAADARRIIVAPVEASPGHYRLSWGEGAKAQERLVSLAQTQDGSGSVLVDGRSFDADIRPLGDDQIEVLLGGARFVHTVLDERQARKRAGGAGGAGNAKPELKSPMVGKIIAVLLQPGQAVAPGEKAVVVEAMKMENELKAHRAGVVGEVRVKPGDLVEVGTVLLTIQDPQG
jgi:biotin carboxyl carrier protein